MDTSMVSEMVKKKVHRFRPSIIMKLVVLISQWHWVHDGLEPAKIWNKSLKSAMRAFVISIWG